MQNIKKLEKELIENIKIETKDEKILLGVSGGIDSTVLSMLINKAKPNRLYCLFIDSGLNRLNEDKKIEKFLKKKKINIKIINIKEKILKRLKGKIKSSDKKEIIKELFKETFNSYAKSIGAKYIAHGTNKNDKELLFNNQRLMIGTKFKDLEPFINLTKRDIILIAKFLKIPKEIISKYPLSSWGMSRKIIGELNSKKLDYILRLDKIYLDLLKKYNYYSKLKNASVYLYPTFSNKDEKFFIIMKAITKKNEPANLPIQFFNKVSSKIKKEIPNISRITYDLSDKKIINNEWD